MLKQYFWQCVSLVEQVAILLLPILHFLFVGVIHVVLMSV